MVSVSVHGIKRVMVQTAKDMGILRDERGFRAKIQDVRPFVMAHEMNLVPTPYFVEALAYVEKARLLQMASLLGKPVPKVKDPLMEAIPIYNTVERRYAGFSNVPELLWYGWNAPKFVNGQHVGHLQNTPHPPKYKVRSDNWTPWRQRNMTDPHYLESWLYVLLAHRITGSGASFEHDHGFRNNRIIEMQSVGQDVGAMAGFLGDYDGPIFTSIGNQIPPFPTMGGRQYLKLIAPKFVVHVALMLTETAKISGPMGIKPAVDTVLSIHKSLGCKQFKFVLTAWVMDIAEYLPNLVDRNSDVYHGKNAIEAINICFEKLPCHTRQEWYDAATRLFANISRTTPMDVEDASPGCDFVRWIENYVPKKGFDHVIEKNIFNGSSLLWKAGRQPSTGVKGSK